LESTGPKRKAGTRAPEQTFEEVKYLKHLIENGIPIRVRLSSNEEVSGTVEYYDASFIRITRKGEPNLFIFKHDIKYLYEEGS
jgi:host factor-I protein